METLSFLIVPILVLHVFAFVLYNKYRIRQLIKYISLSRGKELSELAFSELLDSYTSFLGYSKFSPSREDYPSLYTNQEFAAFAKRSKNIMIYFASIMAAGIVGSAIIDSIQR
jgi:hypothetical protein